MGPEFFQTVMGHRFYEGDVPRLVKALERIADALEKRNETNDEKTARVPEFFDMKTIDQITRRE